ncbi:MAG: ABC transporter permease subunit [Oligoflexia bacterium]|nr:ABC transporter permease subunit [Oligoflexia bacterium]
MALQHPIPKRLITIADLVVFVLVGAAIYGVVATGRLWREDFHPLTEIDLSVQALPLYVLYSAMRGLAAYALSLIFTFSVGYLAAKNKTAEKFILPLLDIGQSIPVLGFLPGLVLGLISIFPNTNMGLELAAIIMIFTSQTWNMAFSFYASLKSIPPDLYEASQMMGLSGWRKFWRLEVPYSAVNLAWNSIISIAGGWFFLSVCEAFTLGNKDFRLPGIGSYMAVAFNQGRTDAIIYGIVAMLALIILFDLILWHPLMSWVRRFQIEESLGLDPTEPLMLLFLKDSRIIRWLKNFYRRRRLLALEARLKKATAPETQSPLDAQVRAVKKQVPKILKAVLVIVLIFFSLILFDGIAKLFQTLIQIPGGTWAQLLGSASLTLLRVTGAVLLSAAWAVPFGIWLGLSPHRIRIAQPTIQILASFPAPMIFPLAISILDRLYVPFGISSMFLMVLGVQWYVLFNVLAGAMRISKELQDSLLLADASPIDRWKHLYLPSIFPALVPGLTAAAGGAWNASIVAEYISFKGTLHSTRGLGSEIGIAAANGEFATLAASLTLMVTIVVVLNRTLWASLYDLAEKRFRMDY